MRLGLIIGMTLWMTQIYAGFVVDIYGDNSAKGQAILHKFQPSLIQLVKRKLQLDKTDGKQNVLLMKKLKQRHDQLIKRIKKEGHYLYVNDSVVVYPHNPKRYITLEVIKPQDKYRMRWARPFTNCANCSAKQDVIQAMIDYEEIGTKLMLENQLDLKHLDCQSYHCSFGFKHPDLKPFRQRFDKGLAQERQVIIDALNEPDPVRRAAAAFVVGEFENPQIIFKLLLPHVNDVDTRVRNNVIRVLGDTMIHSHDYHIDVKPFIALLRSPYVSDRNKSLVVLMEASKLKEQKIIIKKEGLVALQELVKLKQPNNHDFAQIILTQLAKSDG